MIKWYDERIWSGMVTLLIVMLLAVCLFSGCSHTKYVTVPEYHREYVVRTDTVVRADSVLMHDSVFVYRSGDTVIVSKVAYRDRWRNVYRVRTDTVLRSDTVSVPQMVERQLSAWERFQMKFAVWAMAAMCLMLVWVGYEIYKRIRYGYKHKSEDTEK